MCAFPHAMMIQKNAQMAHVLVKASVILRVMPKRMFVTMEHVNPSIQQPAWANSAKMHRYSVTKPVTGMTVRKAMDVISVIASRALHRNAKIMSAVKTARVNARVVRGYHAVRSKRV